MQLAWLLVVVCVVGSAYGVVKHTDDCCSVEDKKEIAWMWHKIWHSSYTDRKVRIMTAVYKHMKESHPEINAFLESRNLGEETSAKYKAYLVRQVQSFDNLINLLDEPLVLQAQLEFMKERFGANAALHKSYFEALAEGLETVLPQTASCFNAAAWTRCLDRLAHTLAEKVQD